MAPDKEPAGGPEHEDWEEPPRSIFGSTWFRVVIVVLVVGAVAAVSIPYVMDAVNPPRPASPPARVAAPPAPAPAPAPATPPPAATAPAPPAAPPAPSSPVASAVTKPAEPPKAPAKAAPKAAKQQASKADAPAKRTAKATAAATERGEFWVQVGAFRDPATAKRVASGLREKGFQVAESTTTPAAKSTPAAGASAPGDAGDRYDVIVSGGAPGDVVKKLTAKGLSAEERGDGAVVRPSLPLRDAVTLSNDLRGEGLTVTVRRATPPSAPPAAATTTAPATAVNGDTLHRVRVGAFADRTAARAAVDKLQALGYTPFIAKGRE